MGMYRTKDGQILLGNVWTKLSDQNQYLLDNMTSDELARFFITAIPSFDAMFYRVDDQGLVVERDLSDIKAALKNKVAAERYDREMGGFTFGGMFVATDQQTRSVFTAAYLRAAANPGFYIPTYKVPDGPDGPGFFTSLSNSDIIAIGDAMVLFIQSCFNRNKEISDQIDELTTFEEVASFTWTWE